MVKLPPSGRARRLIQLLLAVNVLGLLLVAVWFRCRSLANIPGVNGDEAWYGVQSLRFWREGLHYVQMPTGNPPNLLFLGPMILLHGLFPPSVILLRLVPLASGLITLAINWWFCRWVFDRRTAAISTMILAVLPINIVYSRFAWDTSQSVAATLPVLYLSLAAIRFPEKRVRYLTFAAAALIVAALVHPTNVFAGAAIAAAVFRAEGAVWLRWPDVKRFAATYRTNRRAAFSTILVIGVLLVLAGAWIGSGSSGSARFTRRIGDVGELIRPRTAPHFSVTYARLLTGSTEYRYIAGSRSWFEFPSAGGPDVAGPIGEQAQGWGIDVALFWLMVAAALWMLWRSWQTERRMEDRVLAAAWALGLMAFLWVAGPRALKPGWERYAICLVGPTVVLLARGAALCFESASDKRRFALAVAASLAGWLVLADFQAHYFDFIRQTGGRSSNTFRTAAVEPKRAALNRIVQQHHARAAGQRRPIWIVTGDWFNYWPLRYEAMATGGVRVVVPQETEESEPFQLARRQGRVWYVEYAGSENLRRVRAALAGQTVQQWRFEDYGGQPVLCVLHTPSDAD